MEYKFETVSCNLCHSDDYQSISQKGRFGFPTNVVLCKQCGLGYLNPRWDHESYLWFYRNEYDKYYRPNLIKNESPLSKKKNAIASRLRQFDLFPKEVSSILDIGSGEGNNLKYFKTLFPQSDLYAIEPSVESQKHLKKLGVTLVHEDVSAPWDNEYPGKFDIIILRHVLEHFMDPVQIIKKVRRALSPSGIVYIAVPNSLNPIRHIEKYWFRNVHTYYFNKYSLKNLMDSTDMRTLQLVEGDVFSGAEVYVVARKTDVKTVPRFSEEHYLTQLSVFEKKIKRDNKIISRWAMLIDRIVRKLLTVISIR